MKIIQKQFLLYPGIFLMGGVIQLIVLLMLGELLQLSAKNIFINFTFSGIYWLTLTTSSLNSSKWLDKFIPWVENPLKRTVYTIVSIATYTLVIVYVVDLIADMFILGKSFNDATASLNLGYLEALGVTLGISIIMHGRGFLMSWRQTSIDMEKLKTEQVSTQYQSLKNQVNPHFLFNALNALSSLVYDDQDKAVEFIRKLSRVYRYVLDQKDAEMVKLSDELAFSENFIFLQQIRFGENLKISISKTDESGYIPPLAIQLLVENAIKHNVISEKYPLNINIIVDDDEVRISNNIKEKMSKDSTGIGLKNLKERYNYLTNKEITILNDGKTFEVILPKLALKQ